MAIWLVANASMAPDVVTSGVLISTVLALSLSAFAGAYADIRLTPKAVLHYFLYLGVFLWELVLANLNVARIVFTPKIDIHPGIVKIKTNLKSRTGRLVLANSITLTPGTLVVDIDEDYLYVHWIDVRTKDPEEATREIAAKFEKYLEVIYG
jgi:multicomponent Na+:H+ antiporter subunit E